MKSFSKKYRLVSRVVNDESKPLLANFFSLGFIQGTNFLLSVLTFPYIIRTVGVENFGIVTLFQAIMFYFTVFTDYGFNLSATKDISIQRNDTTKLSKIFSEVLVTKAILLALSIAGIAAVLFLFPEYTDYTSLTFFSLTIVLGQLLQPTWFYQGVERMKYITYINILSRTIYAICIFVFVRQANDYIYINLISGLSSVIGGIISLIIVFKKFNILFYLPGIKGVWGQLITGWNIFISNVTVTIANNTNILILGIFATPLVLGYYSIAEKVYIISRSFATILHQVVYPRVCMLAQQSYLELRGFLKKVFLLILLTFLPLALVTFVMSDYIVYLISGQYLQEPSLILKIVAIGPLMAALSIPVSQTMLALHLSKNYAIIVSIGAFVNVSLNFTLAYYFQAIGTAWCILITETLVAGMLYFALFRFYPQYFFLTKEAGVSKA